MDDDVRCWLRIRAAFAVAGASVMLSLIFWAGLSGTAANEVPAALAHPPGSAGTASEQ